MDWLFAAVVPGRYWTFTAPPLATVDVEETDVTVLVAVAGTVVNVAVLVAVEGATVDVFVLVAVGGMAVDVAVLVAVEGATVGVFVFVAVEGAIVDVALTSVAVAVFAVCVVPV